MEPWQRASGWDSPEWRSSYDAINAPGLLLPLKKEEKNGFLPRQCRL